LTKSWKKGGKLSLGKPASENAGGEKARSVLGGEIGDSALKKGKKKKVFQKITGDMQKKSSHQGRSQCGEKGKFPVTIRITRRNLGSFATGEGGGPGRDFLGGVKSAPLRPPKKKLVFCWRGHVAPKGKGQGGGSVASVASCGNSLRVEKKTTPRV